MQRRPINPWTWQDNYGFVQANEITEGRRLLICSGQTSLDENGAAVNVGDINAQFNKAIDNLEAVLKAADMDLSNLVKITVFTTDVDAYFGAAAANASRWAGAQFASSLIGVARLANPDMMVEIEAVAWA